MTGQYWVSWPGTGYLTISKNGKQTKKHLSPQFHSLFCTQLLIVHNVDISSELCSLIQYLYHLAVRISQSLRNTHQQTKTIFNSCVRVADSRLQWSHMEDLALVSIICIFLLFVHPPPPHCTPYLCYFAVVAILVTNNNNNNNNNSN